MWPLACGSILGEDVYKRQGQKQAESNFIQENIDNAVAQETIQTDIIEKYGKILNPRTIDKDGNIVYVPVSYTHLDVYKRQMLYWSFSS